MSTKRIILNVTAYIGWLVFCGLLIAVAYHMTKG